MVQNKKQKIEFVQKLAAELKKSKVIAVASLQGLPARHYNSIKNRLRGKAELSFGRAKLLKRALEAGKPECKELEKFMQGNCALLSTDESAFKIAKLLRESKSKAAAKPGQLAPHDIVVPAGETNLPPGPVLTELKQAGVQAKIQGQKVVISSDATIAKKGQAITQQAAAILSKLAIEPMEIGMRLNAAFEDGLVYSEEVLGLDDSYWLESLAAAHQQALNLSVQAQIFNKHSTELLLQKAAREALALQKIIGEKAPAPQNEEKGEKSEQPSNEAQPETQQPQPEAQQQ